MKLFPQDYCDRVTEGVSLALACYEYENGRVSPEILRAAALLLHPKCGGCHLELCESCARRLADGRPLEQFTVQSMSRYCVLCREECCPMLISVHSLCAPEDQE